jgi:hypothetical protein
MDLGRYGGRGGRWRTSDVVLSWRWGCGGVDVERDVDCGFGRGEK